MKTENIINNIRNHYITIGLNHWLGECYPQHDNPTFPMCEGDDVKRKFLDDNIKIANFKEHKRYRCYVIVTSWVGDPVIEFLVKLSKKQTKYISKHWSSVSTLNDEESRWVQWGTSVDPLTKLSWIGLWVDDAERTAKYTLRR